MNADTVSPTKQIFLFLLRTLYFDTVKYRRKIKRINAAVNPIGSSKYVQK